MTQSTLQLTTVPREHKSAPEFASQVGISWRDDEVVLSFMKGSGWGNKACMIKMDRGLAMRLSELLNYEIDARINEGALAS